MGQKKIKMNGDYSVTYGKDKKWKEAKKFIEEQGMKNNWIEVVDYYRQIGGKHVSVFVAINKIKYMILEATIDNQVILVDKDNNVILGDYEEVYSSRKMFYYIEEPFNVKLEVDKDILSRTYNNATTITIVRGEE